MASNRQSNPSKDDAPKTIVTNAKLRGVALYAYAATEDNEASIEPGDEIADAECSEDAPDWLLGSVVRTGKRGYVPASYVCISEC